MPRDRIDRLKQSQLDRRFQQLRDCRDGAQAPAVGWIATLRQSLGMTQADLGRRLGVTQQAVQRLEKREAEGSATLKAVRAAAGALGAELLYAVVPTGSVAQTLERRAYRLAAEMMRSVEHTMRLEGQETGVSLDERIEELARELLEHPSQLWSEPDGE